MPDGFWLALGEPGLVWVCGASLVAGLVYGFAGFGAALIFMPLATLILPPAVAVAALSLSALVSLVTVVPGAWKVADRGAVLMMLAASLVTMPLGIMALRFAPVAVLQAAIAGLTLVTLAALLAGWRVPVGAGRRAQAGVGALAGLTGGSTGLNGPPVILFNLGANQAVTVTRGNLGSFLALNSLAFVPQLWALGLLPGAVVWLGVILAVPYGVGTAVGGWLFRPELAGIYRNFAYLLIGGAGVAALPVWG